MSALDLRQGGQGGQGALSPVIGPEGRSAFRGNNPGNGSLASLGSLSPFGLAALHYALDLGRPVFPCMPRGKAPITRRGLRDATTREATIRQWWGRTPDANVALLLGYGLVCVDVDGPEGEESLRELERRHGKLPRSVEQRSGRREGGRHLIFATDVSIRSGKLAPGIDVKGERSYIVVAPSVHPSGGVYTWTRAPGKVPLAALPAWLAGMLTDPGRVQALGVSSGGHPRNAQRARPTTTGERTHDTSRSAADARRALELVRESATDEQIARVLRRSQKYREEERGGRGDRYVERTIAWARDFQARGLVRARITRATFQRLEARYGKPMLARLLLTLATEDGEIVSADVVIPSPGYECARETFEATFPGLEAPPLTLDGWRRVRVIGKALDVAIDHGGRVRWMRAAESEVNR